MASLGDRLKENWANHGLQPRSGASEAEVRAFEEHQSIVLPSDLREYFRTVDGCDDVDRDEFRFFPLAQVEKYKSPKDSGSYFVLVDYMIGSHGYAIRLSAEPSDANPVVLAWVDGSRVAESFTEFVEKYLRNWVELSPWTGWSRFPERRDELG